MLTHNDAWRTECGSEKHLEHCPHWVSTQGAWIWAVFILFLRRAPSVTSGAGFMTPVDSEGLDHLFSKSSYTRMNKNTSVKAFRQACPAFPPHSDALKVYSGTISYIKLPRAWQPLVPAHWVQHDFPSKRCHPASRPTLPGDEGPARPVGDSQALRSTSSLALSSGRPPCAGGLLPSLGFSASTQASPGFFP